jgi:hypothetical protein
VEWELLRCCGGFWDFFDRIDRIGRILGSLDRRTGFSGWIGR